MCEFQNKFFTNYNMKPYNTIPTHHAYDFEKTGYVKAPEPSANGGHYTGEPFRKDAEYRDFPVKADAFYFNQQIVPEARHQDVDSHRPGNNLRMLDRESGNYESINGVTCRKEGTPKKMEICAYEKNMYAIW